MRQILADSQIAAVAILVLVIKTLITVVSILPDGLLIIVEAVSTNNYHGNATNRLMIGKSAILVLTASSYFAAAWLFSKWIYGGDPVQTLKKYADWVARQNNA
jgi:hypothetical protein